MAALVKVLLTAALLSPIYAPLSYLLGLIAWNVAAYFVPEAGTEAAGLHFFSGLMAAIGHSLLLHLPKLVGRDLPRNLAIGFVAGAGAVVLFAMFFTSGFRGFAAMLLVAFGGCAGSMVMMYFTIARYIGIPKRAQRL